MSRKDVTGDGVYTQKDLLVERGVLKKRGDKVVKAVDGKYVCPRKEMAGALSMPKMNRRGK
tara:strand:- start:457 stop:639 length:183 start_codon:yes stop_codon:yes gene_type:complete